MLQDSERSIVGCIQEAHKVYTNLKLYLMAISDQFLSNDSLFIQFAHLIECTFTNCTYARFETLDNVMSSSLKCTYSNHSNCFGKEDNQLLRLTNEFHIASRWEQMLEIMGSGPTLFQRDSSILLVAYGFFCVEILTNCNAGLYRVLEKVLEVLDQD